MRRILIAVATSALVLSLAPPAQAAGPDVHSIIMAKTGADAVQVRTSQKVGTQGLKVGIGHDSTGKVLDSFAQSSATKVRMLVKITNASQSTMNYSLNLPAGSKVTPVGDGTLAIHREVTGPSTAVEASATIDAFSIIGAPWASDANGKALATSYTYSHGVLTQKVNLTHATFPVVADPSVTWGFVAIFAHFNRSDVLWSYRHSSYYQMGSAACLLLGYVPVAGLLLQVACGAMAFYMIVNLAPYKIVKG